MRRIAACHAQKPWRRFTDWFALGGIITAALLAYNPAPAIWIAHLLR